jgi:hypothetical protein
MYLVAQGDTRYRFSLDTIEKIVEEGVMSDPANFVSASETDTPGPEGDGTSDSTANLKHTKKPKGGSSKGIENYISRLAGAFNDMPENHGKKEIAQRIREKLGVKPAMSYRIVRQLVEAGKIRRDKHDKKKWDVVDPVLDPYWGESYEESKAEGLFKGTLEEYMAEEIKRDYY